MLQPSLRTTGDICRPALYGIYLLEATANQLTSRSRRRQKMLAKTRRNENEDGDGSQRSQVATTKEPRARQRERDFIKLLCAACASYFGGGLALTRFSIHLHMDMACTYVCVCECVSLLHMANRRGCGYTLQTRELCAICGRSGGQARNRGGNEERMEAEDEVEWEPFEARKRQPQVHL